MIPARDDASNAQALAIIAEPVLHAATRAEVARSLAEAGVHGAALAQAGAAALQAFTGLSDAQVRMRRCFAQDAAADGSFRDEMAPLGMQRAAEAFALALHQLQQPWQALVDDACEEAERADGRRSFTLDAAAQMAAAAGAALAMFANPDTRAALPVAGIAGARLLAAIGTLTDAADRHAAAIREGRERGAMRRRLRRLLRRQAPADPLSAATIELAACLARLGRIIAELAAGVCIEAIRSEQVWTALAAGFSPRASGRT